MPPATPSAPAALTQIQGQIAALEQVLRSQHETLRQRGIILPADVLEKLYYAQTDLARLEPHLAGHSAELERLRALAHTTQIVNSSLELDGVLEQVMDTAIALIGAERGFIVLQSSRTGELEFRVARDNQQRTIEPDRFNISRTILTEVARSGQPVIAQDALLDPAYGAKASIAAQATRSILCVPLIFRERVTGVLYADNRRVAGLFGEKELNLLAAFAHQAAIAIENARLYDRARRTLDEITEIKEIMDNVFESIASGVITTNNAHTILTCNRAAGRILNVTPGAIVGRSLQDVFPALFERAHGLIDVVYRDQTPQSMEIEPVMPGRGAVNLRIKLTPLQDVNNITYGLVIVADDLTAIKQREATLSVVRTYLSPRLVRHIQSIDDLGLSGDEREVSIVFADVRGFTTFSEHLPPEELMSVITRYLTVASDAIELHDGIIDKYMGDAVVGLFNTQLNPQDDHAVRAVRAALSMAYDVRALHEVLPPEQRLSYGIGIDTGTAMLGNVGSPSRKEFTAIGRPFNFAKLLQENAQAGQIIVSERTHSLVQHVVECEPRHPRSTKGYADFRVMYRVLRVKKSPE